MRLATLVLVAASLLAFQTRTRGDSHPLRLALTSDRALLLAQADAQIDQLVRSGALRSRGARADLLVAGRVHERFDEFYRGIRVWGGDVVRQTDGVLTLSLSGVLHDDIALSVDATLTPEEARATAARIAGAEPFGGPLPELVVLPLDDGGYALTYICPAITPGGGRQYFIDASDGHVRLALNLFESQVASSGTVVSGIGVLGDTKKVSVLQQAGTYVADDRLRPPALRTYDLRGDLAQALNVLNGIVPLGPANLASEPTTSWTNGANVDAHAHEGFTYDFYFKRFGRRGLDNQDSRIIGLTHTVRLQDFATAPPAIRGTFYLNAFYCPSCGTDGKGMMVYGEGLPSDVVVVVGTTRASVRNFAAALDVVAHELTHGVTAYTSNLLGRNEAGALNEAFSDMMGVSVEFFAQPAGSGPGRADYLMGEDFVSTPVPGLVRSIENPQAFGTPDHYSRRLLDPDDNGEVHDNSTIASHAFYLSIEGGINRTSGLAVQGVGAANREQIEKTFYRGFTSLLTSNATFAQARAATIQSARDLYGAGSAVERAVTQAWTAVGVN